MSKFIAWFSTEAGRATSSLAAAAAVTSISMITWLPNSPLIDKYRDFVQLYKNGFPVRVPQDVLNLAKVVESDLKLEEKTIKKIEYFTVFGFDVFNAGSTTYRTGALIGLPLNVSYKSSDDIDKKNIMVGNKTIHWTTPEGLALESSLLLTDSAKKFAIARELVTASGQKVTIQTALNGGCSLLCYYLAYSFNKKAKMFQRSFSVRATLYGLIVFFTGTLWAFLTDFVTVTREEQIDKEVCNLGIEYTKGAVEFYTKILQRNVALRSLLGSEGIQLYTAMGNDQYLIRTKHLPFTVRRDTALSHYQSLTNNSPPTVPTTIST